MASGDAIGQPIASVHSHLARGIAPADAAARPGRVRAVGLLDDEDAAAGPDRHDRAAVVRVAQPSPHPGRAEAEPVGQPPESVHHRPMADLGSARRSRRSGP
jgi:hypothetical protein